MSIINLLSNYPTVAVLRILVYCFYFLLMFVAVGRLIVEYVRNKRMLFEFSATIYLLNSVICEPFLWLVAHFSSEQNWILVSEWLMGYFTIVMSMAIIVRCSKPEMLRRNLSFFVMVVGVMYWAVDYYLMCSISQMVNTVTFVGLAFLGFKKRKNSKQVLSDLLMGLVFYCNLFSDILRHRSDIDWRSVQYLQYLNIVVISVFALNLMVIHINAKPKKFVGFTTWYNVTNRNFFVLITLAFFEMPIGIVFNQLT
jgi:hypothetical protein